MNLLRRDALRKAALLGLGACSLSVLAQDGALRRPWPAGTPTPPVALPGFEGPGFELAQARGKVVLLNFWASWCEPCRSEMPALELLAQRYEARGLQVLAVNHRETDAALRRFLQQMPVDLPILRDADGAVARAYGVRIFPTSVLIARDGRAAFSVIGELDWTGPQARQWIEPLLG
ncbi:TlpA family protein disulfide reductase [Roseateles sp.]|jgi:thiol-disulfide isomerase/thioredoxin|uniref:TlpA family protein disulfide reductase n=1 Tax=Roseateles sp. TaxID=1971397 RepID=UPI00391AE9BD